MTHLMIDGKVVGSQQILQLVKTFLVLVFLLGGWAFLGSIMPFECLGVVGEGHMSGLPSRLGQL